MINTLYLPELREMLAGADAEGLREFCSALHPARTADFMEGLGATETWDVFEHADPAVRSEIFGYFPLPKQVEMIEAADRTMAARFIANLPPDDRVDLLKQTDPAIVEQLMPLIPSDDRRDILRLQSYPEDTAGSLMTTAFARLSESSTMREALDAIISQTEELETIYYLYILDDAGHLQGLITARQLLAAMRNPQASVSQAMERDLVTANVLDTPEEVAKKVARFDLLAIPVVDAERHMVGIVTHDDVIDVMVAEATEDAHRMGGIVPLDENILTASFATVWRKRVGWLSLLFVAELFTFTALARYENAIGAVLALSLFVPLCISTGGNSGSQAATLITRALAVGQINPRDWLRVLRRELSMGLALGATLGAIAFVRAALTPQGVLGNADRWILALVISQSVGFICLWGTLIGAMLPLLFRRLGIDPGVASSPFVATFVDVTGIVIYFNVAQLYLL